jgi:cytoskeleton protein RodZ
MSDQPSVQNPVAAPAPEPAVPAAAGALMRQAREASGLNLDALAASLKVPVKKLEALEAGRIDELLDVVFARGLAASVCRTLGIDPVPVLEKLPHGPAAVLPGLAGINAPFQPHATVKGLSQGVWSGRPGVMAVLALLLAAALVGFLPDLQKSFEWLQGRAPREARSTGAVVAAPPALAGEAPGLGPMPLTPAPSDGPAQPQSDATEPVAGPLPVSSAPAAPVALNTAALVEAPVVGAMLLFKARASSWVEVTDARGSVVLRRTLSAGESATASGTAPLQAVVGRADAVDVQVRGKAFELATMAKENVARFEVK